MRRGEVWRVRLSASPGHAQADDRPALVVQHDAFTAALPTVLVVPFTGSAAAARFAGTLRIDPDGANGLTVPSVALASNSGQSISGTAYNGSARSRPRRSRRC